MPTVPAAATPPRSTARTILFHGGWVALLAIAVGYAPWFVVGASPGWLDSRELLNLAVLVACPLAVVLAIRAERTRPGGVSGGEAFLVGAGVATVAALLAALLAAAAVALAGDGFPQAIYDNHVDALHAAGGSELDAALAALEAGRPMLFSPLLNGVGTGSLLLFAGLVATALAAPLLRTRAAG